MASDETEARRPAAGSFCSAKVVPGAPDMLHAVDLSGQRVLVVENDYYLATDTAFALRAAGAKVIGPLATEEAARRGLATNGPTGAVIDVNLGTGPSFDFARELKARGVPFVFVTGYDPEFIPAEFAQVPLLQKPVDPALAVIRLAEVLRHQA